MHPSGDKNMKKFSLQRNFRATSVALAAASLAAATLPASAAEPGTQKVVSLTKVGEARVSRTVYDYTFKVQVQNGRTPMRGLKARLAVAGASAIIVDGDVDVGDLDVGESTIPGDTVTIRQDRSEAFDPGALVWQFTGEEDRRPVGPVSTWFGITNLHYQIGDLSFIQDGAVSGTYTGRTLTAEQAVDKVWSALAKGGASVPAYMFIGHDHGDHSQDTAVWAAKFPDMKIIAANTQCASLATKGIRNSCTSWAPSNTDGNYAMQLGEYVTIRPVKWKHADHSGCVTTNTLFPTVGLLITTETRKGRVHIWVHDSGSGNNLNQNVTEAGLGTFLNPIDSLTNAMRNAGATRIDLWQGGSETRVIKQAKWIVPRWHPKVFQPQHWAEQNMLAGIPYDYYPGPAFSSYLSTNGVAVLKQQNYLDAVMVTPSGTKRIDNAAAKAEMGLPATGSGPGPVGPHPRLATQPNGQCDEDTDFVAG
jgi:hypothetical protein